MVVEILIYAVIAAFFFVQYRRVLGQRPDDTNLSPLKKPNPSDGNVITLNANRVRSRGKGDAAETEKMPEFPPSLAGVLANIRYYDGSFDEKNFLEGAKKAFSLILKKYAAGDVAGLEGLLKAPALDSFRAEITQRQASGHTLELEIKAIQYAEIVKGSVNHHVAELDVQFTSEEVRLIKDASGNALEESDGTPEQVVDTWTFARDLKSGSNRWYLTHVRDDS